MKTRLLTVLSLAAAILLSVGHVRADWEPLPPPESCSVSGGPCAGDGVFVSWSRVDGAVSYRVYTRSGSFNTTRTEYRDTQAVIGRSTYFVTAVDALGLESDPSPSAEICLELCFEGVPFSRQCGLS